MPCFVKKVMATLVGTLVASLPLATAQVPPFPFGNATRDLFTGPNGPFSVYDRYSDVLNLPNKPMTLWYRNATSVIQAINGYIEMNFALLNFAGGFYIYASDIDTRNGGVGQNEVWLRAGTNATDLKLASDIIAGTGTMFLPQAIVVATWNKVEAFERRRGAQNTFQLAMAYSDTGETWAIFAYSQLEYFSSDKGNMAFVSYVDGGTGMYKNSIANVTSNETMYELLNGTNCNRKGIYAYRIPVVSAPTGAPIEVPVSVKCGMLGWSIFCPLLRCGILGRWLGLCRFGI